MWKTVKNVILKYRNINVIFYGGTSTIAINGPQGVSHHNWATMDGLSLKNVLLLF